ncbi:hypothetical protein GF406_11015 [candidate division KSB1 bacterium]|nr:hypothetical protein [candidate division KSB1 bacterium]
MAEIRKQCSFISPNPILYHWRSHRQAEVDIVLERDGIFYPIAVKAKSRPTRQDTSGITAFRKTYPHLKIEKGMVIAPTEKTIPLSENDFAIPWHIHINAESSGRM